MINQRKVLEFYDEYKLSIEKLFFCYNIYLRNSQQTPENNKLLDKYYKENSLEYIKMIDELVERDFIELLKPIKDGVIELKYVRVTDKFENLMFCNPDEIWENFYIRYPAKGVSPDGYSYFTANLLDKDDKEYFKKHILKNADKFEAEKMIFIISEMFDWNPTTRKPEAFAKVGVSKFIRNYQTIVKQWEEEQSENSGSWGTKRY